MKKALLLLMIAAIASKAKANTFIAGNVATVNEKRAPGIYRSSQSILLNPMIYVMDTTTIWFSDRCINQSDGGEVELNCSFVIEGDQIIWRQKGGAHVYNFSVLRKEGQWNSFQEDGALTYHVTLNGLESTVEVSRTQGSSKLHLIVAPGTDDEMNLEFNITSIEIQ